MKKRAPIRIKRKKSEGQSPSLFCNDAGKLADAVVQGTELRLDAHEQKCRDAHRETVAAERRQKIAHIITPSALYMQRGVHVLHPCSKGTTDKFSPPSSHICTVLSSSTNPRRSTATPPVCLLDRYSTSVQIWATSFYQRFPRKSCACPSDRCAPPCRGTDHRH